jgi:hypothetical protein
MLSFQQGIAGAGVVRRKNQYSQISAWFWIDILVDLVTFLAFGVATIALITSICS